MSWLNLEVGTVKDLRETIRETRLKLSGLEVLLAAEGERRTEGWFSGTAPADGERGEATHRLVERGLLEARPAPVHYALSDSGRRMLANIRAKIAPDGRVDWNRVGEVDFPLM